MRIVSGRRPSQLKRKFVISVPNAESLELDIDIAIRTKILNTLKDVGLPKAQSVADNPSIADQISIITPYRTPNGYIAGLKVPRKYRFVERGTVGEGVYIEPVHQAALMFADGKFSMYANFKGQPGRHFLQEGIRVTREVLKGWSPLKTSKGP